MSEYKNVDINIYIDNSLIKKIQRNEKRPDVLKAIKGYGESTTNPIPGFKTDIDICNIEDGNKSLKIEVVNSKTKELITSKEERITIKKYNSKMYLDNPEGNITINKNLEVRRLGNVRMLRYRYKIIY